MTMRILCLVAGLAVLFTAAGLESQLPPTWKYAVASLQFSSGGDNEVAFVDNKGKIARYVKLGVGTILPGSVCNTAMNDGLLVFDRNGVHVIDFVTQKRTYTTLTGAPSSTSQKNQTLT